MTVYHEPEGNGYRVAKIYLTGDEILLRAFGEEHVSVADFGL